jgi:asparagine synthase (glutamine-hydrolysing)
MANLVGIVSDSQEERRDFISRVRGELRLFDWLRAGEKEFNHASVAWACHPSAPISSAARDGWEALVLGTFDENDGAGLSDAERVLQLRERRGRLGFSGLNGYYLAAMFDPEGRVLLATDLLGLFPLYYYSASRVLVFSTTPSVFHSFRGFSPKISPEGLSGVLMTMHAVHGQTIWRGVRRLSAGHVLRWSPREGAVERAGERLVPTDRYFDYSLDRAKEMFDHSLTGIAKRAAAGRNVTVMLSGGLDSRLVSGYLDAAGPASAEAITFGDRSDIEMCCARAVAKRLRWRHRQIPIDFTPYPDHAERQLRLEQMSTSFVDLAWWSCLIDHRERPKNLASGFLGDSVMGGTHMDWARDPASRTCNFDTLFGRNNRYGFAPGEIGRLLRADFLAHDPVEIVEQMRSDYESAGGEPFQRAWVFDLLNRQRFHTAAYAWRLCFWAWPLMPYTDKGILQAAAGMPERLFESRILQTGLLRSRFKDLARLPLDRNTPDMTPLEMGRAARLKWRLFQWPPVFRLLHGNVERRYYARVFHVNNPGWLAVRQIAEGYKRRVSDIFEPSALDQALPPPPQPLPVAEPVIDNSARFTTLLGLVILLGRHV